MLVGSLDNLFVNKNNESKHVNKHHRVIFIVKFKKKKNLLTKTTDLTTDGLCVRRVTRQACARPTVTEQQENLSLKRSGLFLFWS